MRVSRHTRWLSKSRQVAKRPRGVLHSRRYGREARRSPLGCDLGTGSQGEIVRLLSPPPSPSGAASGRAGAQLRTLERAPATVAWLSDVVRACTVGWRRIRLVRRQPGAAAFCPSVVAAGSFVASLCGTSTVKRHVLFPTRLSQDSSRAKLTLPSAGASNPLASAGSIVAEPRSAQDSMGAGSVIHERSRSCAPASGWHAEIAPENRGECARSV